MKESKKVTDVRMADMSDKLDVFFHTRKPRFILEKNKSEPLSRCFACGQSAGFKHLSIINDDLAKEWALDKDLRDGFDIRESTKCNNCGSSMRSNLHARTICTLLAPKSDSLLDAIKSSEFQKLKIAEINACGALHKILHNHPNLQYSEYMPADKSVRHETLDGLTYSDNTFDLVLTSETFEHVPDWEAAMKEIRRVLKPGGVHIFTIPTILTRKTRTRATRSSDGKVKNLLKPSFHGYNRGVTSDYTVFNEFGADIRASIDAHGFNTSIYYRNIAHLTDPNFVFVSVKV